MELKASSDPTVRNPHVPIRTGQKWQVGPEIAETIGRIKHQEIVGRVQVRSRRAWLVSVSTSLVQGHEDGTKGHGRRRGVKGEPRAIYHQGHVTRFSRKMEHMGRHH